MKFSAPPAGGSKISTKLANMAFILGEKIGMTQIFKDNGEVSPVTLIAAGPCVVVQIRTKEKDGYSSVQLGFGKKRAKIIKKPQKGHLNKLKVKSSKLKVEDFARYSKEFRIRPEEREKFKAGDIIDVGVFKEGEKIKISGINKGKGFQGVVKRHGFHGGPKTHGGKHSLRAPGSIGATHPQHVIKGKRMPGRMGGERVTVKNLEIVKIDKENNLLAVKGGVPGRKGTLLEVTSV